MGNHLRELREANGYSLRALADLVGIVSYQTIANWEEDGLPASADRDAVWQIARGFGREIVDVFPETEGMPRFRALEPTTAVPIGPWEATPARLPRVASGQALVNEELPDALVTPNSAPTSARVMPSV